MWKRKGTTIIVFHVKKDCTTIIVLGKIGVNHSHAFISGKICFIPHKIHPFRIHNICVAIFTVCTILTIFTISAVNTGNTLLALYTLLTLYTLLSLDPLLTL